MEYEKLCKQIKLSDPPLTSQAALELINKAKHLKPSGTKWPTSSSGELIEWNALDVIIIHIVFSETNLVEPKRSFKPKLAHQIFGQKEKMFGYLFPKIHLYFLANSSKCFLKFTHEGISNHQTDAINGKMFDNLISWLPQDFVTEEHKFLEALKNEDHCKMFGKTIMECKLYNYKENSYSKFIIKECNVNEPGFVEFHSRFECLIVWYIDAASQLDLEDRNWMFLYVYEEIYVPETKQTGYYPVGYSAVYKFFHFPDKIRARISQCFVLPCCQRMGVGYKLLTATYQAICNLPKVVDITVEDPCPTFQRLRDNVDSTLLRKLDSFKYPLIKNGFTKKMMDDANSVYKINKRQCRRVYHILRMGYALVSGDNEDENLIKDMRCFLGIPPQPVYTKTTEENEIKNEFQSFQELKVPSLHEKYTNEIRPIAWRISELLKEDLKQNNTEA